MLLLNRKSPLSVANEAGAYFSGWSSLPCLFLKEGIQIFDLICQVVLHVFDRCVVDGGADLFDECIEDLIGFEIAEFLIKVIHEHRNDGSAKQPFLLGGEFNFHRLQSTSSGCMGTPVLRAN